MDFTPAVENTHLKLNFDIEEDVEAELEEFVRLNRIGRFDEAHEVFDECLEPYQEWFPVAAEFADCLLHQCRYDALLRFTERQYDKNWGSQELNVFRLIGIRAKCHQTENVQGLIEEAVSIWLELAIEKPFRASKDTEVRISTDRRKL